MVPGIQTKDFEILSPFYRDVAKENLASLYAILICAFLYYEYNLAYYDKKDNEKDVEKLITDLKNNYNLSNKDLLLIFSFIYVVTDDKTYCIIPAGKLNELDLIWLIDRYDKDISDESIVKLYSLKISECIGMHEKLDFFIHLINDYESFDYIKGNLNRMIKEN